jgi:hypothetical protein
MNLRARYRTLLTALDPQSPASAAEVYTPPPADTAGRVARMMELAPTTSHLLCGDIGSGKSTQLHHALTALSVDPELLVVAGDAAQHHDLRTFTADGLVALVGLLIGAASALPPDDADIARLRELAYNSWERREFVDWPDFDPDGVIAREPPLVQPDTAPPELDQVVSRIASRAAASRGATSAIVLLDGLDRVSDPAALNAAAQGVRRLRALGVGLVATASGAVARAAPSAFTDAFDEVHLQPVIDPTTPEGQSWFDELLRRRDPVGLLSAAAREALAANAGGALRDLISLTRNAVDAAWLEGATKVTASHVEAGRLKLADRLARGLSDEQLTMLRDAAAAGTAARMGATAEHLLRTGRLIEVTWPHPAVRVHPALVPLLKRRAA